MFHVADFEAVKRGEVVDVYFTRTRQILEAKGIDARVKAEFMCKGLPHGWDWAVLSGLEEAHSLLVELDVKVRAMPEGTIFRAFEPVMEIEGRYLEFGHLETALLGLICQASGVATMAARCRKAAGDRGLFSFGARRMHPVLAPMLERNAWVGGCDGVAVGMGAALVGQEPVGTMPHALILIIGDTVTATKAFDEVIDPAVRRISLIDTFQDEKFEALRIAEAMGDRLWGIRLDTPSSRRGSMLKIVEEVRWELDLAGYHDVKITVSGGLTEETITALAPIVDAFGVGTAISNAPVIDFSMDLVEINGRPVAKRGKRAGSKKVLRCSHCYRNQVVSQIVEPEPCSCQRGEWQSLLIPAPAAPPSPQAVRAYVLDQLPHFSLNLPGGDPDP
ncbi:MAG: nicotinate phosphoribosyltransferase [Deltaproteobacteria bacterium]|nr:nicotinate phosphoribosyltransferase [Deltaproteobacteria bacterium]